MERMNLIERIQHELDTDYVNSDDQSERLIALYQNADAAGRALLDDAFICVCGCRLTTLLEQPS